MVVGMMNSGRRIFGFAILILGTYFNGYSQSAPTQILTRDQAVYLALRQASRFEQANLNEQIALEEVVQARSAFYPTISANSGVIYNTPALGSEASGSPRPPSFLGANAITEFQATAIAAGEIDTSGRLKANKRRAF
ncbi:MAG: TolC family protein, partial [Acidobacteria bacterium]|nr:TolC family protein [Acidobacteriota bacterium]